MLTVSLDLIEVVLDFVETGNQMYKKPEYWSTIKKFQGFHKTKIIKKLDSLSRQKFIEKVENRYYLTKRGRQKFNQLNCHFSLNLPKGISWEGKWYLVIFDIPQKQKNDRHKLRNILKTAGLIKLQQSVYAYPHDLFKEFKQIQSIFPKRQLILIESDSIVLTTLLYNKFKEKNIII